VQHSDDGQFIFSFYEVLPPVLLGDSDEIREQLNKLQSITANCVARLVISSVEVPKIIGALAQNYEKFINSKTDTNDPNSNTKGKKHAS
jgi:hypothetical protein